jgi:hypothetical protein
MPEPDYVVAACGPDPTMLFASLLNSTLLHALAGFERIVNDESPAESSLLGGHNHIFEKRFRYPKWKPAG